MAATPLPVSLSVEECHFDLALPRSFGWCELTHSITTIATITISYAISPRVVVAIEYSGFAFRAVPSGRAIVAAAITAVGDFSFADVGIRACRSFSPFILNFAPSISSSSSTIGAVFSGLFLEACFRFGQTDFPGSI